MRLAASLVGKHGGEPVVSTNYQLTGIVYSHEFRGTGGPSSNDGIITVSIDGGPNDIATIYLTGPGSNDVITVTMEEFLQRVAAIYRSYCYRLPLTFTLRGGVTSLPLILSIDMPI